jgi:hypothetical protein
MSLGKAERQKLLPLLDELARAVESLLRTGLTTASETTRQTLNVTFQEASRMRLLRLGATLRVANEELGRFTRKESGFSRRRLIFFLNRAWLLSQGLARAIRTGDEKGFERLLWVPANEPAARLEVVTLGVGKKVVTGAYCAFEFRLRTVQRAGRIPVGQRLLWACVFPFKPGVEIPAEGFLHLPQKQKFTPNLFLEGRIVTIEQAAVTRDEHGGGRISLAEQSTVTLGEPFKDWEQFHTWDAQAALKRIQDHQPGPLDLEVELQEEVVLDDWQVGETAERDDSYVAYPITSGPLQFDALVSRTEEGKALRKALDGWRKKKRRPPLFGLMHYDRCLLVLQPLAVLTSTGPEQLMLSDEKIDRATLLKTLKF